MIHQKLTENSKICEEFHFNEKSWSSGFNLISHNYGGGGGSEGLSWCGHFQPPSVNTGLINKLICRIFHQFYFHSLVLNSSS